MEASKQDYVFTLEQKKTLTPSDQTTFLKAFKAYDLNGDGTIDTKEFKNCMINMGFRKITDEECSKMLAEQDKNNDGVISWAEFVEMMVKMKGTVDGRFGSVIEGKGGAMAQLVSAHGGTHTYKIEEKHTFAYVINEVLKGDEDLSERLPINPEDDDLFHAFDNGIMLCKLMMKIDENVIDSRAINRMQNMNVYQVKENLLMGLAAAKGLGVKVTGIDSRDFIDKTPHLILAVVWQIVRMQVSKSITLKDCPEIMRLAKEGETLQDLMKLSPETILIRWVNYHLEKAGQERRIANLGKDIADSFALMHVLNRLDSAKCPLAGIDEPDLDVRAGKMINNSMALGVPRVVQPHDICSGNEKVNTLFVAYIFNTKHGLEDLTQEEYDAAGMLDDDIEASKEERTFRLWINSLGIEDVYVNNLIDECKDGVLLCKVIHKVDEKAIDWKKVDLAPNNDFKRNINNNTAIEGCKNMGLKMIGIGGVDITKGERKLVLATCWQICKTHYLKLIGGKTEDELVAWANQTVGDKHPPIKALKDPILGDGKYLINMLGSIEPRAVNWDLVLPGETDDDKKNNAKYAVSIARKLGAVIFALWEDIVQVNPKQMLIFFATMNEIALDL